MAGRPWRSPPLCIHALLEICPSLPGDLDLALGELPCVLAEHVKEDDQVPRTSVQDPVELAAVVAPELPQLPLDLRRVREGQVRVCRRKHVEAVDLEVDRRLP